MIDALNIAFFFIYGLTAIGIVMWGSITSGGVIREIADKMRGKK
jgi:hypothetical protein